MGQTKIEWTATVGPDGAISPGFTFNPWIGGHPDKRHDLEQFPLDLRVRQFPTLKEQTQ